MTVLVLGATGATGRCLVTHLVERGHDVRAIVRSPDRLPEAVRDRVDVTAAAILDLNDAQLEEHVRGCRAVVSCLGHNPSFRGIFGKPRRLVTDATRRLCEAIEANAEGTVTRFVLMSSSGVRNSDLKERISLPQKAVIFLLRHLVPPHADNECAAEHLRTRIGRGHPQIEWIAVRPDGLIHEDEVTPYELHSSPTRSAIFNAGKVSRINVAHFMAELIDDDELWVRWKGQMPVMYSRDQP